MEVYGVPTRPRFCHCRDRGSMLSRGADRGAEALALFATYFISEFNSLRLLVT